MNFHTRVRNRPSVARPGSVLYLPVSQSMHCVMLVAPCVELHDPAVQFWQSVDDDARTWSLYFPLSQFWQSVIEVRATWSLYVPLLQSLHAVCPFSLLYVPAVHSSHELSSLRVST